MKQHVFHVTGTHCNSCKILIEDVLGEEAAVRNVRVDLKKKRISLDSSEEGAPLLAKINSILKHHGYMVSQEKTEDATQDSAIWQALPIGLGLLALFFALQKSGILNLGIGGQITPVTSFLIGIVASLSSCLAVVGGLVLSLSAKVAQDDRSNKKPFVLFHAGRLAGFALFGGILGFIGKEIGINYAFSASLGLLASFVMIVLGLNLSGILKRNVFTFSGNAFSFFRKLEHKTFAPLLIGAGTFFLPCGFTQSMQVAALSSSSAFSGFAIMASFALGTLPMLALLSFGSASFARSKHAPLFFQSAGIVVIWLGIFAFLAGLAGLGIIPPLFNI